MRAIARVARDPWSMRDRVLHSIRQEVRASLIAKDGVARLGKPEDIAALALFLCSERARHIQGTAIAVDGGATPGLY
jgi:3-oxoacyl-[acyl-carrier protein] reductase